MASSVHLRRDVRQKDRIERENIVLKLEFFRLQKSYIDKNLEVLLESASFFTNLIIGFMNEFQSPTEYSPSILVIQQTMVSRYLFDPHMPRKSTIAMQRLR